MRDVRRLQRRLLAGCLVAGPVALVATFATWPSYGADTAAEAVRSAARHSTALNLSTWLTVPVIVCMIPAMLAAGRITRRSAPLLSLSGTALAVLGWAAVYAPIAIDSVARQAAAEPGRPQAVIHLYDRFENADVGLSIAFGFFIAGHVLGTALVGCALWRSRSVERWGATLIVVGSVLHPVARVAVGSRWLDVLAALLLTAGLAAVARVVWTLPDDDWDLAPRWVEEEPAPIPAPSAG
jgi:hypothetical protein